MRSAAGVRSGSLSALQILYRETGSFAIYRECRREPIRDYERGWKGEVKGEGMEGKEGREEEEGGDASPMSEAGRLHCFLMSSGSIARS